MELHFCDLCNESVPQVDLDEGRAFLRAGHVVCARCEGAMSGPGPSERQAAPPAGPTGAPGHAGARAGEPARVLAPAQVSPALARRGPGHGLAVVLSTIALMGTVGASAYFFERVQGEERRLVGRMDDLREDVRNDRRLLEARVDQQLAQLDSGLALLGEEQGERIDQGLEELAGARREELLALRAEIDRVVARLEEVSGLRTFLDRHERDLAQLGTTVAELHAEVRRVGERVVAVQAEAGGTTPAATPTSAGASSRPDWWPVLDELASQSSGTRWQAVQTLGNTGDPDTAEHLVPMLDDPDIFVRMATARILGDLAAVVGIPALIEALEDPEASVREAAVVSLRGVTGQNFRFDPTARENERSKRVRAWEEWWKKASKDLLGSKTFEKGEG